MNETAAIVDELIAHPIGLWTGTEREREFERGYLGMLRPSYDRTVRDVSSMLPKGSRIIEFGAYLGVVSKTLSTMGYLVTASDHPKSLAMAAKESFANYGVNRYLLDLAEADWDLKRQFFDAAILCETLEHLPFNPIPTLREIDRILKPGGLFYVSVPNVVCLRNRALLLSGRSFLNPVDDFLEQLRPDSLMDVGIHWHEYTMRELQDLLWNCGFGTRYCYYFDIENPARGRLWRFAKRLIVRTFPSLSSTIVVMAEKL